MRDENPILDSVLQIAELELRDDFERSYHESKKELGDGFNIVMQTLSETITAMQNDCKPGTSVLEVVVLMIMTNIDEPPEDEKRLNKYLKACALWMLEKEYKDKKR